MGKLLTSSACGMAATTGTVCCCTATPGSAAAQHTHTHHKGLRLGNINPVGSVNNRETTSLALAVANSAAVGTHCHCRPGTGGPGTCSEQALRDEYVDVLSPSPFVRCKFEADMRTEIQAGELPASPLGTCPARASPPALGVGLAGG